MNSDTISVFNAHTGCTFKINRFYFVSLDEFRRFCSSEFNIPINRLFFLSSFGILIRNSSFEEIDDIYVYDKELFSTGENDSLVRKYIDSQKHYDLQPLMSPLLDISLDTVSKSRNSKQLISLLTTNLGWVAAIESDCSLAVNKMKDLDKKIQTLMTSIKVSSQYIDSYCSNIKKTYNESVDYMNQLHLSSLNNKWADEFNNLKRLKMLNNKPLSNLLNKSELSTYSNESISINKEINNELIKFNPLIESSENQRSNINLEIDQLNNEILIFLNSTNYIDIYNELITISEIVRNDTKNLLNKTSNSIDDLDVDIILETFQLHKSNYVSKIYELSMIIYSNSLKYKDLFINLQFKSYNFLKKLSNSQLNMISIKESLKLMTLNFEKIQTLESYLAHTIDLPLLYGLYLIENMRRSQWLINIKSISIKSNEKFAQLREREIKSRNQWIKNYGIILKLLNFEISSFNNSNLISFEIIKNEDLSITSDEISYDDCLNFINQLKSENFDNEIINILLKNLKDSIFKKPNFNIDVDPAKKIDNDTIKGYKSRIKKLENLLHQEQFKNFNQWPSNIGSTNKYNLVKSSSTAENTNNSLLISLSRSPSPNNVIVEKLEYEIKELKNLLTLEQKNCTNLKKELNTFKASLSSLEFSNHNLAEKNKELLSLKQIEINQLHQKFTRQEIQSIKFESESLSKDELIKSLKLKLKDKDDQFNKLELKFKEKKDELNELELALKEKNIEFNTVNQLSSKFENDLKLKDDQINELKSKHEEETCNLKFVHEEEKLKLKSIHEEETVNLKSEYDEQMKSLSVQEDSPYAEHSEFENNLAEFQNEINSLKDQLNLKNEELRKASNKFNNELNSKNLEIEKFKELNSTNEANLKTINEDFERLKSMKNDLLENMTNREDEFTKEKIVYQDEIELLKSKIEEFENFEQENESNNENNDIILKYKQLNLQLLIIINSLIIKSRDLTEILVRFYDIFLTSLKSLGLLAIINENKNNSTDIIRVKGLRKNNNTSIDNLNVSTIVELNNGFKPIFKDDLIPKSLIWEDFNQNSNLEKMIEDNDEILNNEEFLINLNDVIINNYNLITFEQKYLTFVKFITNLNSIYLSCVSKRFNEVENLAKKELKENKKLRLNNDRLKISIKDFQIDDLVLFLPTKINENNEDNNDNEIKVIQWAAFNDMGDCKFLMKTNNNKKISPNKQWFIGKILNIEKINSKEFLLTTEEIN